MWDVGDVGCWRCGMLEMWDVAGVGCSGCGCWRCGMFGMWYVRDVGCSGCGMFGMWDVRDVGCGMFAGMWDVDLQNASLLQKSCNFNHSNLLLLINEVKLFASH